MGRPIIEDRAAATTPKLGRLLPHHRSLARLLIGGAMTPGDLAKATGFSPFQISVIINSPLFQEELSRLERMADQVTAEVSVREDLLAMQARSVEVLDEDLYVDPENLAGRRLRQNAALEILSRTGIPKTDKPFRPSRFSATQVNILIGGQKPSQMDVDDLRQNVFSLIEADWEEVEDAF